MTETDLQTPPQGSTSYDAVPYESFPYRQTHPDKLATIAGLLGLHPKPPADCRVLELGCASGGNLLPLAMTYPGSEFVGVDLSPVQIEQGQVAIEACGIGNVRLLARSVRDIDEALGQFDYIIAHGLYSWVPDAVQDAILRVCSQNLDPDGVAYVSYNTLPGWHMHGLIRDLIRFHAKGFSDPAQRVRQARDILDFLAQAVPMDNSPYALLVHADLEKLRKLPDYYILHEHLEETNEPLYFHQFVERAQRHRLQYLAESDFSTMVASGFAPQVGETLRRMAPDVVRQEQLVDFLRNRSFRQTLLVHAERRIERQISPERVHALWASALVHAQRNAPDLRPGVLEQFSTATGTTITTSKAITKAALMVLTERWPQSIAFTELLSAAHRRVHGALSQGPSAHDKQTLANDLLYGFSHKLLELHASASSFAARVQDKPLVTALVRWQAQTGQPVTNLRHEVLYLTDLIRTLLPLLDGTRDRAAILTAQSALTASQLDQALDEIARVALLVAPGR
jgi:methyltransferase-like protein/SAM-dependent methyltransferase